MMQKTLRYVFWFSFSSVLIAFLIYVSTYSRHSMHNVSCTADYIQHSESMQLNMAINYTFGKHRGFVDLTGKTIDKNGAESVLNRDIAFVYYQDSGYYYLSSSANIKFPDDNTDTDLLNESLPEFFTKNNKSIVLRIMENGERNYFFFIGLVPVYLCKKRI